MSNSIDERIVEMRFDNKQFESGISESTKSLENLRKSLKLEDATKGLKEVENAGKKFNLDAVSAALEAVTSKFSILGTIGDQIIRNLTNEFYKLASQAIATVKSLSIDQVAAGWQKYTDKTESVQTILNATGRTIEDVNENLEKLRWYTDETSYNFVDMTSNIGKFTSAGVELEDAVDAMMGIANWAGVSGANTQQASRAMYNLSQAMSMDKVMTRDWMSIEIANMATLEFKQTVIDTALELGYLRKMQDGTIETMYGTKVTAEGLRDTLSDDWFSGAVLVGTLKKYSDYTNAVYEVADSYDTCAEAMEHVDGSTMVLGEKAFKAAQEYRTLKDALDATKDAVSSGWMETFEILFGNLIESKKLWTSVGNELYNVFSAGAEARNEILLSWKEKGGFKALTDGISNIYNSIKRLVKYAKEGLSKIFPAITDERLLKFSRSFELLTEKFRRWSEDWRTASVVIKVFKGLASIFDIIKKVATALITPFGRIREELEKTGRGAFNLLGNFFDLFSRLNESEKFQEVLDKMSEKIGDALVWIVHFAEKAKPVLNKIGEFFSKVADKISGAFKKTKESINDFGNTDTGKTETVFEKIKSKIEPLKFILDPFIKTFQIVVAIAKKVWPVLQSLFRAMMSVINNILDGVKDFVESIDTTKFVKLANSGGMFALLITIGEMFHNFSGIVGEFKGTIGSFKDIVNNIGVAIKNLSTAATRNINADTLKKVAISIAILSASMILLCLVDTKKLYAAVGAITALFIELFGSMKYLQSGSGLKNLDKAAQLKKAAGIMIKFAIAIAILAVALKTVGELDIKQVGAGLAAIGGLMAELEISFYVMGKNADNYKKVTKVAFGMILFAVAIKMLTKPMMQLSQLSVGEIVKGLSAIGILMAELGAFAKLAGGQKKMISIGVGMIAIALAIKILASAVKKFGEMDIPTLAKGLISVGIAITGIAAAMKLMPKGMVLKSEGFVITAAGLLIVAEAVKKFGSLDIPTLLKGLIGIGAAVVGISAAMNLMPKAPVLRATSFVILASGLKIVAGAVTTLGALSWNDLVKGLVGIGAAVVGMSAAINLMPDKKVMRKAHAFDEMAAGLLIIASVMERISVITWEDVAKGLITMGVAVVGISSAMNLIPGKGSMKAAIAFLVLAASLHVLIPVIKGLGELPFATIIKGMIAMAAAFGLMVAAGYAISPISSDVVKFSLAIMLLATAAATFATAMDKITTSILNLVNAHDAVFTMFFDLNKMIITELPGMIHSLAEGMRQALPDIVDIMVLMLRVFTDVIREQVPMIVNTFLDVIFEVLDALKEKTPDILDRLFTFLLDVFKALRTYVPQISKEIVDMLKETFGYIIDSIGGLSVENVAKAIASLSVIATMFTLITTIAVLGMATTAMLPVIGKNLNKFTDSITPFLDTMKNVNTSSLKGAQALANTILALTAASILEALGFWVGASAISFADFGSELAKLAPYLKRYSDGIAGIDARTVEKSAIAASALAEFASNLPRHGGLAQLIAGETDLISFAEGLVELGPNLLAYSQSVKGLDSDVVVKSIEAAQVISAFADNLPRHEGLVQKIIGDNSLNEFAEGLAVFGPNLVLYAKSVHGLDANAVTESIRAAEVVSEFAANLPNEGGLISKIIGDNTLSMWGTELALFGPRLADFANSVKDVDADAVRASAYASKSLFEIANIIPNEGGFIADIIGDNTLGQFAKELVPFGTALAKYSDSVVDVNKERIENSAAAAKAIFDIADFMPKQGGFVSKLVGDNTLGDFAEGLIPFGEALNSYSKSVTGLSKDDIVTSAEATKALFEAANEMPNQGGVKSWFAGDNKIGKFAEGLEPYGKALKSYGESVKGLAVDDIESSANATKNFFEVVALMPDQGGVKSWFVGDNTLSKFAKDLAAYGPALAEYGESVKDIKSNKIISSAIATKELFKIIDEMPNQGGVESWFTGDNTLSKFAKDLAAYGPSLKEYSDSVSGVKFVWVKESAECTKAFFEALSEMPDQGGVKSWFAGDNTLGKMAKDLADYGPSLAAYGESVKSLPFYSVKASAECTKQLFETLSQMPDQGGVKSWFEGDNTLGRFAEDLVEYGAAMKSYGDNIANIPFYLIQASAESTKTFFDLISQLPEQGGIASWFTGDQSLSNLAKDLEKFGPALKIYGDSVVDLPNEAIVTSADTTKAFIDLINELPPQGRVAQWFTGDQRLSFLAKDLEEYGPSLKLYSDAIVGINNDSIVASAETTKSFIELINALPAQGRVAQWFAGDKRLSILAKDLEDYGPSLKLYSDAIVGINNEDIVASATTTKSFIELINALPAQGRVAQWFTGDKRLSILANDLEDYGPSLKEYSDSVLDLNHDAIIKSADTSEKFLNIINNLPKTGVQQWFSGQQSLSKFGNQIASLGFSFKDYSTNITGISWYAFSLSIETAQRFVDLAENMSVTDFSGVSNFVSSFTSMGENGVDGFISAFSDSKFADAKEKAKQLIVAAITGLNENGYRLSNAASSIAFQAFNSMNSYTSLYYNIGVNAALGVINGMNSQQLAANLTASTFATNTLNSMSRAMRIKSPSRATFEMGEYLVEGLVNGMDENVKEATDSSSTIGSEVLLAMEQAIASVMALMQSDGALAPVIRPVVDLSDARKQAAQMDGMFGATQIGGYGLYAATSINRSIQNGQVSTNNNAGSVTNNNAAINININTAPGQNAEEIANAVQKRLKQSLDQRGYAFR